MVRKSSAMLFTFFLLMPLLLTAQVTNPVSPVVAYSDPTSGWFIGNPSLVILPNGWYVASHDKWQWEPTAFESTSIYVSKDRGNTWQYTSRLNGQICSDLFLVNNVLYTMGINRSWREGLNAITICKSTDNGASWTNPVSLTPAGGYWGTPATSTIIFQNRLWKAGEYSDTADVFPLPNQTFIMNADVSSNLLSPASWKFSNKLPFPADKFPGCSAWLEPSIFTDGTTVNVMARLQSDTTPNKGALLWASSQTAIQVTGFRDFPGGMSKFTIQYDSVSAKYWSLTNNVTNPDNVNQRNIITLIWSMNRRDWFISKTLIELPGDDTQVAAQYLDWQFDGDDIIAVSRTAWDGAHNYHDANYMTFHRFKDFRN